jgi:hypothetical protein
MFTCSGKLPLLEEQHRLKQPHVSPERYDVNDELVRQTKYKKILVGGSCPKDSFAVNSNPGPGEYE